MQQMAWDLPAGDGDILSCYYLHPVTDFQVRAISLEAGLRNASLVMSIAQLIQDSMGDSHSSMCWLSGMFGLTMNIAGRIAIKVYPKLFPVKKMIGDW